MAGWSTNNDSAGNVLKSAIDAFYATYAAGCLPTFAAVPPTQCPIESTYPGGMSGISHTMWASNCGNVIANWCNRSLGIKKLYFRYLYINLRSVYMTKKELVRLIREVVKREIKSAVQTELNEALTIMENKNSQKQKYTSNTTLNEVLNQTSTDDHFAPEMADFKSNMRSQFMSMQGASPATQMTDVNNVPVNPNTLDPSLSKALNRDYSELVKRFK